MSGFREKLKKLRPNPKIKIEDRRTHRSALAERFNDVFAGIQSMKSQDRMVMDDDYKGYAMGGPVMGPGGGLGSLMGYGGMPNPAMRQAPPMVPQGNMRQAPPSLVPKGPMPGMPMPQVPQGDMRQAPPSLMPKGPPTGMPMPQGGLGSMMLSNLAGGAPMASGGPMGHPPWAGDISMLMNRFGNHPQFGGNRFGWHPGMAAGGIVELAGGGLAKYSMPKGSDMLNPSKWGAYSGGSDGDIGEWLKNWFYSGKPPTQSNINIDNQYPPSEDMANANSPPGRPGTLEWLIGRKPNPDSYPDAGYERRTEDKPGLLSLPAGPASLSPMGSHDVYSGDPLASEDAFQNPAEPQTAPAEPDEMDGVKQALTDLLTPANQDSADLTGLADMMKPKAGDDLQRFGYAMAAGESPFMGQNAGAAGLAMLKGKDEGLTRYYEALSHAQDAQETRRHNAAEEKLAGATGLFNMKNRTEDKQITVTEGKRKMAVVALTRAYQSELEAIDKNQLFIGDEAKKDEAKAAVLKKLYTALNMLGVLDDDVLSSIVGSKSEAVDVAD